jgi:hypothetical protein
MKKFKSYKGVVSYEAVLNESTLIVADDSREDSFYSVGYSLGNNL